MEGTVPNERTRSRPFGRNTNPDVVQLADAKHVTLNADKDRIQFDVKTMDVFWLMASAGWKAIKMLSPLVSGPQVAPDGC